MPSPRWRALFEAHRGPLLAWCVIMVPLVAWALALWPAVMTNDSVDTWNQAAVGPVVDWHPAAYTYIQRAVHHSVGSPSGVILLQCAAMAWSIRRVLDLAIGLGVRPLLANGFGVIVAALPPVGAFTAHLWKDVPYTVGFLLVTAWLVRQVLVRTRLGERGESILGETVVLGVGLVLLATMRLNGPLVVAPVAVTIVVVAVSRRAAVAVIGAVAAITVALSVVVFPAAGMEPVAEHVRGGLYIFDLAALYQRHPSEVPDRARPSLEMYATAAEYRAEFNCHWAGSAFQSRFYEERAVSLPDLQSAWWSGLRSDPLGFVGAHLCGASPTWNPVPAPEELAQRETVLDYVVPNPQGVVSDPVSDRLGAAARGLLRHIGRGTVPQVLLWRAATWMWLLAGLVAVAAWRRRRPFLLWILVPFLAQSLSVVALAGPHYRYMAPAWAGAVLLIPVGVQLLRSSVAPLAQRTEPEIDATDGDHEAHHPDPLLQRGGDAAGDTGRPPS